jgi:hypothetical protein
LQQVNRGEIIHQDQRESRDEVVIKYLTWTEGLGWCAQKTIRVNPDQIDDLHRALTVARHRINARRANQGETVTPAKVIKLPAVA